VVFGVGISVCPFGHREIQHLILKFSDVMLSPTNPPVHSVVHITGIHRFPSREMFPRWGHKRYYIKEEETIKLQDQSISTRTQWNPKNIKAFIDQAKKFGWVIELK
jgi:hypothetical protein